MHINASLVVAGLLLCPAFLQAAVVISSQPGFTVTWDGNDGDGFNPASPAAAPANLANAPGATAFTSGDLGPQIGVPFHVGANINDGLYGNANSWIGGDGVAGAAFAGINLGGTFNLNAIAFGRDNGNGAFDDSDPGTDCCGGQLDDRNLGIYTLQITMVANPSSSTPDTGSSATGWQTIGTLDYQASDDMAPGGLFSGHFRHEYGIAANGAGITATGFRLLVPATGLGAGTAIDEIEIYGTAVPEPTATLTALAGLGLLLGRRSRGRA